MSKNKKTKKNDRVPRRQLVTELAHSNARVIELATESEEWRDKHANAMRKMNTYAQMLHDIVEVMAAIKREMKEM